MKVNETIEYTNQYGLHESQARGLQALSDWWNSNELECTLRGYAGTGKTFLLKTFIKTVVNKTFIITAPTHKALTVMEQHLGIKGMTFQALHGLKPNVEMADFDINNLQFMSIGRPKMQNYTLMMVDESSMVNSHLYDLTLERCKEYNIKVLWIGDPLQLLPVKEQESKVFTSSPRVIVLDKIIRQKDSNPLLKLFVLLRHDIEHNTSHCLKYMADHPTNIVNGEGYKMIGLLEYKELIIEYFKKEEFYDDINFVRVTGFTNAQISNWNNYIRDNIFETKGCSLILEDLITGYTTLVEEDNSVIITNSEDYIISSIRTYRNEYRLDVYIVTLKSARDRKETKMLQILDHANPTNVNNYIDILTVLRNKAKAVGGKKGWFPYYKFKNTVLGMINIDVSGLKLTRELDYGYALTVHKLQGSTFTNIFVDGNDICNPF